MTLPKADALRDFVDMLQGNNVPVPEATCQDDEVRKLRGETMQEKADAMARRLAGGQTGPTRTGEPGAEGDKMDAELAKKPGTREPGSDFNPKIGT